MKNLTKDEKNALVTLQATGAMTVTNVLCPEGSSLVRRNLLASLYHKGYATRHLIGMSTCYMPV